MAGTPHLPGHRRNANPSPNPIPPPPHPTTLRLLIPRPTHTLNSSPQLPSLLPHVLDSSMRADNGAILHDSRGHEFLLALTADAEFLVFEEEHVFDGTEFGEKRDEGVFGEG